MNVCKECGYERRSGQEKCIVCETRKETREMVKAELLNFIEEKEFEPQAIIDRIKNL